jgi:hypothetical protein
MRWVGQRLELGQIALHFQPTHSIYSLSKVLRDPPRFDHDAPFRVGFISDQFVLDTTIRTVETPYIRLRHVALPSCRLAKLTYRMEPTSAVGVDV